MDRKEDGIPPTSGHGGQDYFLKIFFPRSYLGPVILAKRRAREPRCGFLLNIERYKDAHARLLGASLGVFLELIWSWTWVKCGCVGAAKTLTVTAFVLLRPSRPTPSSSHTCQQALLEPQSRSCGTELLNHGASRSHRLQGSTEPPMLRLVPWCHASRRKRFHAPMLNIYTCECGRGYVSVHVYADVQP